MHTVKPLDTDAIDRAVATSDTVFVIEEHTRVGGLGSAVVDYLAESHHLSCRIFCHGIADRYVETGNYAFLLQRNRLDAAGISEFVLQKLGRG